ncbi:MAG: heat-inducible transcription repressor HrcA [Clostridia bacterium]|nr:heat-inducible transcription repressor HrcA [Clostridia bacterium]
MVQPAELSERKKKILKAIIDVHIRLGEPVGSEFLTQNEQIALSSATIRNEMAELEEMGYLEQPHTSAGRVPSRAGYRLYVDSLMNRYPISSRETEELNGLVKSRIDALDKLLEQAGKMVSVLTNYTSLTMKAGSAHGVVRRFDAVWLDENSFILVMTLDGDTVRSKTVHLPFETDAETLKRLMEVLNETVAGIPMDGINLPRMVAMEQAMGENAHLVSPVIKNVYEVIGTSDTGDIRFEGVNRMLQYPEFSDVDRIREMFDVLEKKDEIMDVMTHAKSDGVNVIIGGETTVRQMENSTLVFKNLTENGRVVGAIGVIGPCRMDYSKVVTLIDCMTDRISHVLDGTSDGTAASPPSLTGQKSPPGTKG